jgi:hypothetical protein
MIIIGIRRVRSMGTAGGMVVEVAEAEVEVEE